MANIANLVTDPDEEQTYKDLAKQKNFVQWQVGPNKCFIPTGKTIDNLPSGNYWTGHSDSVGAFLQFRSIIGDNIVEIPDSASAKVIQIMKKFWASREKYNQFGLVFKRGILLWGPPGGGKTITVRQLSIQIIALGGIVIHCETPVLLERLLQAARAIEPLKPIICVYEDVDEIIRSNGEHSLLALLDGEVQTDNVVHVATTNYPDRLDARIANRPSRFDDRVYVGMPSPVQRMVYLRHIAGSAMTVGFDQWVEDTEGFSIAHIRELFIAVHCLELDYTETLERLRSMNERVKPVDGFSEKSIGGFGGSPKALRFIQSTLTSRS